MPLVGNTTSGALTRTRIADYIAASESVTPVTVTDAARTLTAAELFVNKLFVSFPTGARVWTTPTATELATYVSDEVVGTSFEFTIVNTGTSTAPITVTGGTGVTVVGVAAVAHATSGTFVGVVTAATTVSIYRK